MCLEELFERRRRGFGVHLRINNKCQNLSSLSPTSVSSSKSTKSIVSSAHSRPKIVRIQLAKRKRRRIAETARRGVVERELLRD